MEVVGFKEEQYELGGCTGEGEIYNSVQVENGLVVQ